MSIDSGTQITMTKNALSNGTVSLEFSSVPIGVYHERNCALIDAKNICNNRGQDVLLILRDETKITRDRYGAIQKINDDTRYWFKSYPINYNPTVEELKAAGLTEKSETIVYIANKDFRDNNLNFQDIDINRSSIVIDNEDFEIREKGRASQFSDVYLYYTLGLSKR